MKFLTTLDDGWIAASTILKIDEADERNMHQVTYRLGEEIFTAVCAAISVRRFLYEEE
jgi:hypothetical protein